MNGSNKLDSLDIIAIKNYNYKNLIKILLILNKEKLTKNNMKLNKMLNTVMVLIIHKKWEMSPIWLLMLFLKKLNMKN